MRTLSQVKINMSKNIRRLTCDAMLLVSALILSYIESFIPFMLIVPVPGIKLGLANLAVMIAAYGAGETGAGIADAFVISISRIFIMALLFGSISTFWFSLTGGMFSFINLFICVVILKKYVSPLGTSLACAAGHNFGQIIAAILFYDNKFLIYFLPLLLLAALVTGTIIGIILVMMIRRLNNIKYISGEINERQ